MKRFWLPTQKGTELNPKWTQSPTKLVIRGVPSDSPLYAAVARMFSGHLKQFHGKQQQAYSLSGNAIQKGRIDWGDARATYTNIQGQETLELEVDVSLLAKLQRRLTRRLPSWAVARFTLPTLPGSEATNTTYFGGAEMYAVLRSSGEVIDSFQVGSGITTGSSWYKPFKLLSFAGTASNKTNDAYAATADPDQNTLEFELLVDLRAFWTPEHAPTVQIDIYASAVKYDPGHLYGYYNRPTTNIGQDHWIDNSDIGSGGDGAGQLAFLQSKWDTAGLPHSQQSYFVNNHDGQGVLELVLNADAAQSSVTFDRDGNYVNPPPTITQGLPNFITQTTTGQTSDGWRYMVMGTDPVSGLITAWGFNNLIWTTVDGDPFPTVFVLTTGLTVHNFEVLESRGYIDNPYTGPGNIYGQVFFEDVNWFEREWSGSTYVQNWRWVNIDKPDIADYPLVAENISWPNELFPFVSEDVRPPAIKDTKYLLGTLAIDVEAASMSFNTP